MAVENLITEHIDIWTSAVKTKSTSGRGSSKKLELYGVKKLRELILELAVRGKLVPQNPNDEPASFLLQRISEEKTQLIKEKKITKPKKLPAIKKQDITFALPEGWQACYFGDIYSLVYGDNLPKAKRTESGEFLVYGSNGSVGTHNLFSVGSPCLVIGRKGSAGAINLSDQPCWVTDVAYSLIPPVGISLKYCFLHLQTLGLDSLGKGIKPGLNRNEANALVVCIPPSDEQHRIVAKVDELMALCDQLEQQTEASIEAHQLLVTTLLDTLTNSADADELMQNWARISEHFDTLFSTEESIDQLKQTILQLAVMGKLVPQDPSDEPAAELLKRIADEKAQLVKDKKIKKQKALPPIAEDEKPFELPSGWEWCRIQDVALFTTSGSRDWAKYYSDSGALFVTMGNLSRGSYELRLDNLRFVRPPKGGEGSRTKLEARDLLISITGDVGNLGLIPEEFGEAYINQHTCLLRFMPECQGKYFPDFMRSPLAKYQFDAPQRGIKNSFRLSDVGEMHLPLPPLNEQVRITEKVSDLLSICERLKVRLRESQITQLHLTDAIVERAV
ncbi:restriction endonuclease subunit S [Vibrio parahaemolyticus]|uniref:Restriction endonuclease S subunit n=1 Tax=Vibrio vulnificus (strain CMCP6) TaxID=216895 RepID=A0A3Q0L4U9_VIBVU|nr:MULTISPECIES: restriction endonuclease subunit S [Vibrio]AAO10424.1 Restriction endonuclease S subunit [Vibrio vulnificus CMCP6]EJB8405398.1 restriction endonuclease subunit S [Vibrio parahaemolyticus]EJB8532884.1 restriction endonuclease subunit S [Vibrio parahaemolyticus]EJX5603903.1 restriction endonuclease subunit S [Vibrio parahaemolyticus]ELA6924246.1 restriction endonuclease subunit S [Vibrio parahaemolyticus]